ncbi:MAG: prolyl oligopeptidase family serine peptidase [Negativibacillus sp.]|nr:prolyl oligopeptidase family serine peptidase [Negativibacillus sp.]
MAYHYPKFEKSDFSEEFFGHILPDPYHGLKQALDPKVLDWVRQENEFTDRWFDQKELADKIAELKSQKRRPLYTQIGMWNGKLTATKPQDGNFKLVRLDQQMQNEELLFERDTVPNYTASSLRACPSDQNLLMVHGLYDGDPRQNILLIDSKEKKILSTIRDTFGASWSKNRATVYYVDTLSDSQMQTCRSRVCAYDVYTDTLRVLMEDRGNAILGSVSVSSDKKHLLAEMMDDYSHFRYFAIEEESGSICDLSQGKGMQVEYIDTIDDCHYFISKEASALGELLVVEKGQTLQQAKVVRAEKTEVLDGGFVLNGKLYLTMMDNVSAKMVHIEKNGETEIPLPTRFGTLALSGRTEDAVYFTFESFAFPPVLLRFDGEQMEIAMRSSDESYPDVVVEQLFAPSESDGKMIPYFMVRRKDVKPDGQTPTWIYGYGGYNIPALPWATDKVGGLDIARWAMQGGIYVMATLRGGSEYGTDWHEEGMMFHKKNCYGDFFGVTQKLIDDGWTNPKKIVICGCSNGGLLVSTLVTMRPELFGCVIDSVPHTDMIHFTEDARGPMYITEYGNPRESKEMFEYILSYSPYHNVKQTSYPSVYIQTGECDNNVPPYHGKKFAARMQECNQSENPVLLRVLAKGSHDRGSGEAYWQTIAEAQLFVKKALGL